MAKVIKIDPLDVRQQPKFRQRLPDPTHDGETIFSVVRMSDYDEAEKDDVLHLNGIEYLILWKETVGEMREGTIIFHTYHKGQIPIT